jgi:DNA processing protein
MARAAAAGVTVVSGEGACYPPWLKEIYDPPLILCVRGNPELLRPPGIAVMGTRHPSSVRVGDGEAFGV